MIKDHPQRTTDSDRISDQRQQRLFSKWLRTLHCRTRDLSTSDSTGYHRGTAGWPGRCPGPSSSSADDHGDIQDRDCPNLRILWAVLWLSPWGPPLSPESSFQELWASPVPFRSSPRRSWAAGGPLFVGVDLGTFETQLKLADNKMLCDE